MLKLQTLQKIDKKSRALCALEFEIFEKLYFMFPFAISMLYELMKFYYQL